MSRAALLVVLALLAPAAIAHVGNLDQSAALTVGDKFAAAFQPRPSTPFVNDTVSFAVLVSDRTTGYNRPDVPATVLVGGPEGFNARKDLVADGTGWRVGSVAPPAAGTYSVRLLLVDPDTNETSSADTEIEVYPDLPFRVQPVDVAQDVYTGSITRLAFEIVDPISLTRIDPFSDLEVQVEHWTEDHTQMLDSHAAAPEKLGKGLWRIEERFEQAGMYHIRFKSVAAGFNYGDVPLLHVYATAPPPSESADTPFPSVALALVVVGLAALAWRKR